MDIAHGETEGMKVNAMASMESTRVEAMKVESMERVEATAEVEGMAAVEVEGMAEGKI